MNNNEKYHEHISQYFFNQAVNCSGDIALGLVTEHPRGSGLWLSPPVNEIPGDTVSNPFSEAGGGMETLPQGLPMPLHITYAILGGRLLYSPFSLSV